jgi:hypothetical protein
LPRATGNGDCDNWQARYHFWTTINGLLAPS